MIILLISSIIVYSFAYAQDLRPALSSKEPFIRDRNLKVEKVTDGFNFPTGMAFIGPDKILIIEKNVGKVKEVMNGTTIRTILDLNVVNVSEGGLLGIAISKKSNNIFLYYTETQNFDGGKVLGNRLFKYEYSNGKLVNPKMLLVLPAYPGPGHHGGKIQIGSDNNLYMVIGDVQGYKNESSKTVTQNFKNGGKPDGRAGILRIMQDGEPVQPVLGEKGILKIYYAYGIRNSFGIAFDPVSGNLWDTENGPEYGDEINLVRPGFNSGWNEVAGIWEPRNDPKTDYVIGNKLLNPRDVLVDFGGKGKYSSPEFTWNRTVGPTDLIFLNSDKLGKNYENDLFVGTHKGYIYHFDLNENRTELSLSGALKDKVANDKDELSRVVFARNFGVITDLIVGPDGYLYVLSGTGTLFKIVPIKRQ